MRGRTARVMAALLDGIDHADDSVPGRHGGIPVRRYRPDGLPVGTLVWLHGGAFSHGGLDQLESHAVGAALVRQGIEVVAVDYRRVPRWNPWRDPGPGRLPGVRFPVPLDDVVDAFGAVSRERGPVLLGGASAGACLAAAAALRMHAEEDAPPAGLVLAYGTFHAELPPIPEEMRGRVRGRHGLVQFRPDTVRRMNHNYAGSAEAMALPFAFPGGHRLPPLPPSLMVDADRDTLRASGEAFAGELSASGTVVTHHVVREAPHGFLDRPHRPHFATGTALIGDWIISKGTGGVDRHGTRPER
ncbi:MAG TPA: alpha/beta hydrolase fold domain-containing protein [Streptomyces sp.]|uniref:alpha/beta hydrolase fold domain-containing protein n=1 Tax=Streptomyces sp. TaxID=1931 RepID=UPI002C6A1C6E|nr:alpha/beta hydrolase fold domain-containing protein [Streptomyces sp.]HWU07156.1 alpha/beta hydrolase fold domain-containing protein [Streptomyces sp.]